MTNPAAQAARAEPEARRDDEPQDASHDAPVVELSNSGDKQTQNCPNPGLRIAYALPPHISTYVKSRYYQSSKIS